MKYGLSEEQLSEIINLLSECPEIEEAVLFGSRAIDTYKEASDVDIALKGEKVTASLAAKLKFNIEEDTYLPFFFDFIAYPTITNQALKDHINNKGIVLYRKCDNHSDAGKSQKGETGMSEWNECKFGDVITLNYGKALNSQSRIPGDIPVYSSAGLTGYHNEPLINSKGLIVGRKGTIGKVYYSPTPFCCIDTAYYILPNEKKYHFAYMYYLIQTLGFHELNEDSAVPGLNRETAYSQSILIPPLPEQKAIASVLSSLDDKIDLLHRQNKTLEAMAETLFRRWFVEQADDGWDEKPLSSIANFLNGLACQKYPPKNFIKKLPVLKIKELKSGMSESSDWATSDVKAEYIVDAGDVIFAWSASLIVKIWNGERCILNQHLFKVTSDKFPKWFYFMWCKHHLSEFISISLSHATTMGHIKRGDLDDAIVAIPPAKKLEEMSEVMDPFIKKQISNYSQLNSLEKLRDTLLPKLMSGEVRVEI